MLNILSPKMNNSDLTMELVGLNRLEADPSNTSLPEGYIEVSEVDGTPGGNLGTVKNSEKTWDYSNL